MKRSWRAELSRLEGVLIVLVGVAELLVGLLGATGCEENNGHNEQTYLFNTGFTNSTKEPKIVTSRQTLQLLLLNHA